MGLLNKQCSPCGALQLVRSMTAQTTEHLCNARAYHSIDEDLQRPPPLLYELCRHLELENCAFFGERRNYDSCTARLLMHTSESTQAWHYHKLASCLLAELHNNCCRLLTSMCILKPLPKPCKVSEAPDDLCVVFFVLRKLSPGGDLV